MTRSLAIEAIERYFDDDSFFSDLERRVGYRTESQELAQRPELYRYLEQEMIDYLVELGFSCQIEENPDDNGGPFLIAERIEDLRRMLPPPKDPKKRRWWQRNG